MPPRCYSKVIIRRPVTSRIKDGMVNYWLQENWIVKLVSFLSIYAETHLSIGSTSLAVKGSNI